MSERHVSDADVRLIEREEGLITEVQYLVQELMNERGLNRVQLAELLGISKSRVTQLLGDNANPTLRTLVAVFDALGEEIDISRVSRRRQDATAVPEPEATSRDWCVEKQPDLIPARVGDHSEPGFWQGLLELENTRWQVDPASNDNWGAAYDETAIFA
ncbi:helix-turn-helix domain-containing protein [Methylorubrum sp. SL192]|uniref:helix-turn-helix domain-containing protein n=1 Tax=Methylorubrum sp. SL192 TaxID=2995167 RepID=UPI002274CCC8|nr:helix-turn-helix transcriptional regulator [Methylorubrum sp. SL192]MCY1642111.1 helix-turn-helix transcriptional regulator [Methylorubrum sp. SL192]